MKQQETQKQKKKCLFVLPCHFHNKETHTKKNTKTQKHGKKTKDKKTIKKKKKKKAVQLYNI